MRSQFSDAEIDAYRRDGFVTVDDFLDPDELSRWREVVTGAVESTARSEPTGKNSEKAFTQRMHLRRTDDRVRRPGRRSTASADWSPSWRA